MCWICEIPQYKQIRTGALSMLAGHNIDKYNRWLNEDGSVTSALKKEMGKLKKLPPFSGCSYEKILEDFSYTAWEHYRDSWSAWHTWEYRVLKSDIVVGIEHLKAGDNFKADDSPMIMECLENRLGEIFIIGKTKEGEIIRIRKDDPSLVILKG